MSWVERPKWDGLTVVCIASGPSLTPEDCETVRRSGHPVVVTNTTFRLCPWADALFAFDAKWWKVYSDEVVATFQGRRFGGSMLCEVYRANPLIGVPWFRLFANSGASAVSLALAGEAAKILLIGFDGSPGANGEKHWHGTHPKALSNAESMGQWGMHFRNVSRYAKEKGVPVINCSRRTALSYFPRGELAHEL